MGRWSGRQAVESSCGGEWRRRIHKGTRHPLLLTVENSANVGRTRLGGDGSAGGGGHQLYAPSHTSIAALLLLNKKKEKTRRIDRSLVSHRLFRTDSLEVLFELLLVGHDGGTAALGAGLGQVNGDTDRMG